MGLAQTLCKGVNALLTPQITAIETSEAQPSPLMNLKFKRGYCLRNYSFRISLIGPYEGPTGEHTRR